MPALATSTPIGPSRSSTSATAASTCAASVWSQRTVDEPVDVAAAGRDRDGVPGVGQGARAQARPMPSVAARHQRHPGSAHAVDVTLTPWSRWTCRGRGWRRRRRTTSAAPRSSPASTTRPGSRSRCPGHWRSTPAFADADGPLCTARRFDAAAPAHGRRRWLVLDGVFYQGDVWLDGAYLGDTEGYFQPHALRGHRARSATAATTSWPSRSRARPQRDKKAKRNLTGVWQHWDCLDDTWNPGGIWRPVRIEETGPIRIRDLRVLCREASRARAVVVLRANLETRRAAAGRRAHRSVGAVDHELTQPLAAGENHVEWTVTVEQPALWWPWALGDQPLHDVVVEVAPAERARRASATAATAAPACATSSCATGSARSTASGCSSRARTTARPAGAGRGDHRDELRADVELAADAGLDLLRVHAHIARPELYDAADEAGLLLWQDLPLHWGYARSVRKQAVRQARAVVDLLGHHPSVACGAGTTSRSPSTRPRSPTTRGCRVGGRVVVAMELPTWNRSSSTASIKRALRRADGTRPVIAHSGVWPHPPKLDGTDTHLYFGWYHGDERDLPGSSRPPTPRPLRLGVRRPVGARTRRSTPRAGRPDWDRSATTSCDGASSATSRRPTTRRSTSGAGHPGATRRRREAPRRGAAPAQVPADRRVRPVLPRRRPARAVTWSVLDHERRPKAAWDALRGRVPPGHRRGRPPARRRWRPATPWRSTSTSCPTSAGRSTAACTATLSWPGGGHRWRLAATSAPTPACGSGRCSSSRPTSRATSCSTSRSTAPACADHVEP